jgi:Tannase and feruloyl esterase
MREVSRLMDSTNPDLSALHAHGGKLIMLEHMSDYAQSPFAGIGDFRKIQAKLGRSPRRGACIILASCLNDIRTNEEPKPDGWALTLGSVITFHTLAAARL